MRFINGIASFIPFTPLAALRLHMLAHLRRIATLFVHLFPRLRLPIAIPSASSVSPAPTTTALRRTSLPGSDTFSWFHAERFDIDHAVPLIAQFEPHVIERQLRIH